MIFKSKIKNKSIIRSHRKSGGRKPKERSLSDLIKLIKNYLVQKNIYFDNEEEIKEHISKIVNKEFEEMKITKSERQILRNFNKTKMEGSLHDNITYVSDLLNQIEKKLDESEFIKTLEPKKKELSDELQQFKIQKEELNENKLNLMKDVKIYLNLKKIEVSKGTELDEIKQLNDRYFNIINLYTNLIPKLSKELIEQNQLLENMKERIKIQQQNNSLNKQTITLFEEKQLYIAQLEQDIKIIDKTREFLTEYLNEKLEDICVCDKDDVNCQEWLDSQKKGNE